jgi:hypothetical protein
VEHEDDPNVTEFFQTIKRLRRYIFGELQSCSRFRSKKALAWRSKAILEARANGGDRLYKIATIRV